MTVFFSVNEFDKDGDLIDEGIFLHFGDSRVKVAKDLQEYREFISELKNMEQEISEGYYGSE